jgi:hypothetical protein
MRVQLLYFVGCPHVDAARRVLRSALQALGVGDAVVEEFDVEARYTPPELRSRYDRHPRGVLQTSRSATIGSNFVARQAGM